MKYRERTEIEALQLPAPITIVVDGIEKTGKAGDYLVFKGGAADVLTAAEFLKKYEQSPAESKGNPFMVPYPYPVYPSYPSYPWYSQPYWGGVYCGLAASSSDTMLWNNYSSSSLPVGPKAETAGLLTTTSFTLK